MSPDNDQSIQQVNRDSMGTRHISPSANNVNHSTKLNQIIEILIYISRSNVSPHLTLQTPLFVANITIGDKELSRARFK